MATKKNSSKVKKTSSVSRSTAVKWIAVGAAGAKIDDEAYRGKKSLTRIKIADGVTEIGSGVFAGCVNLKAVKIPKSVTRISREAFRGCAKLESIDLAEGVEEIENGAFAACKSLKEIAIPASVKIIRDEAFLDCLRLNRISFNSADTSVEEDAFKRCVVLRKVAAPSGLDEDCTLLSSRGYKAIKSVVDHNAKFGENVDLRAAELELWSYAPVIGTAWVDSLDEVDDDLAECARDEGGGWGALDVSGIGGELKINGEDVDIDFDQVRRVEDGSANTWVEFRDKVGIYSVGIGKTGCSTVFAIAGEFDPRKLTLHYKTAIGPGYYRDTEDVSLDLLNRVEYDSIGLEIDDFDDRNCKGCVFTVFNKGRYAKYAYGCDVSSLNWEKFPGGNNLAEAELDFSLWDRWGDAEWSVLQALLDRHDPMVNAALEKSMWDSDGKNGIDITDFLRYAAAERCPDIVAIAGWVLPQMVGECPALATRDDVQVVLNSWDDRTEEIDIEEDLQWDWKGCDPLERATSQISVLPWVSILYEHPDLDRYCAAWDKFTEKERRLLVVAHPELKRHFEKAECKRKSKKSVTNPRNWLCS